jgi:hypothetical protein
MAKAEHRVRSAELRQMLQSLLSDRFKLQVHWETRVVPVYSLTVAKRGLKRGPKHGTASSRVHWETRVVPVYSLTVAKRGPKHGTASSRRTISHSYGRRTVPAAGRRRRASATPANRWPISPGLSRVWQGSASGRWSTTPA